MSNRKERPDRANRGFSSIEKKSNKLETDYEKMDRGPEEDSKGDRANLDDEEINLKRSKMD